MDWKLILLLALAVGVQANFNAAEGFSGRVADCTSCHAAPHPTDDTAKLVVVGLPAMWDLNQTYRIDVRIQDGPMEREGFPQGGLDVEVLGGQLLPVDGLTHAYYERGLTYTVEGAMVRAWSFDWVAPDLSRRPAPLDVWIAGMAADGGHIVALGAGDQSEKYDSVDTFHVQIPPSETAQQAWIDLPLAPPVWNTTDAGIEGRHADRNATHLAWRTGDTWNQRATGDTWRLAPPATGDLWIRSEGADRISPEIQVQQAGQPFDDAPIQESPVPLALPALLLAALWRRP